jgi:uncharacterized protein (DUF362 family)
VRLSRRDFARAAIGAALGAAAGLGAVPLPQAGTGKSPVVVARSDRLKRIDDDIDEATARRFLDGALMRLTGAPAAQSAWRRLFSPNETVGIKLSCLPGRKLSSSRGLVAAIVSGLRDAGVATDRIIVWERTNRELDNAGFRVSRSGLRVIGTDGEEGGGYAEELEFSGSIGTCFSRIIERVDSLVNVPVLKDHDVTGVSIGMKNFYGAIHNPNKYHGQHGDPFIADLCRHRFIRGKLRLTVVDASRVQVQNGPAYYPKYAVDQGALLAGLDPVAVDFCAWTMLEALRRQAGLPSLAEAGREPTYIATAARMGLGEGRDDRIERIALEAG